MYFLNYAAGHLSVFESPFSLSILSTTSGLASPLNLPFHVLYSSFIQEKSPYHALWCSSLPLQPRCMVWNHQIVWINDASNCPPCCPISQSLSSSVSVNGCAALGFLSIPCLLKSFLLAVSTPLEPLNSRSFNLI